jgi:hypothetical protein
VRSAHCSRSSVQSPYLDGPSLNVPLNERRVLSERPQKLDVRVQPDDPVLLQALAQHAQRVRAVSPRHDELRDHRVVEHADLRAGAEALLEAQRRLAAHGGHDVRRVRAARRPERCAAGRDGGREDRRGRGRGEVYDGARVRHEVVPRRLGVHAGLERPPDERDLRLAKRKRVARRDLELPVHEVEAGDHLRDGVLDLKSRVPAETSAQRRYEKQTIDEHLHEEEVLGVVVEDELDGAGADVIDGCSGSDGFCAKVSAKSCTEAGGRCLRGTNDET